MNTSSLVEEFLQGGCGSGSGEVVRIQRLCMADPSLTMDRGQNIFGPRYAEGFKLLNDISAPDWIKFTKSWFVLSGKVDREKTSVHPATFPLELPQDFIQFFTKRGQHVLDPFFRHRNDAGSRRRFRTSSVRNRPRANIRGL